MRKQAYRRLFLDQSGNMRPDAEVILADLKRFCRANSSTAMVSPISKSIDPMAMAMAEGRREVWNRLMAFLHLEDKIVLNLTDPNSEKPE
jgi:hypothetical protein